MATKTRDLKAEVLSWLRYEYADDPECGDQSAEDIAELFKIEESTALGILQELCEAGKLYCDNRGTTAFQWHYTPIGGRIVFD